MLVWCPLWGMTRLGDPDVLPQQGSTLADGAGWSALPPDVIGYAVA